MKYYLALDKGRVFKNSDRYIKIPLNLVNEKLDQNNNLQMLSTFTTTFTNENELKSFLIGKNILDNRKSYYSISIIYYKDFYRHINVPYKSITKFLDFHYLEELIIKNAKTPNFLEIIIKRYSNYKHLNQELYSLKSFLSNPFADYKLYDVIRKLVNKICFTKTNDKQKTNFKGLLDLAMLISSMVTPKSLNEKEPINSQKSEEWQFYTEDDPRYHHLEELKDQAEKRNDSQIHLF